MAERGVVKRIDGGTAFVELETTPGCKNCGLCHSGGKGKMLLEVEAQPGVEVGQAVLISDTEKSWAASLLLFLLPLICLIGGLVVGQFVPVGSLSPDASSAVWALGAFSFSFIGAFAWERLRKRKQKDKAKIEMVLD